MTHRISSKVRTPKADNAPAPSAAKPEPKLSLLAARAERIAISADRAAMVLDHAKLCEKDARIVFVDAATNGTENEAKLMQIGWEKDLRRVNTAARSVKNRREDARVAKRQADRFDRLKSGDVSKLQKSDLYTRLETIAARFARPAGMSRSDFKDALKDARDNAKPSDTPETIVKRARTARKGNKTPAPSAAPTTQPTPAPVLAAATA